MEREKTTIRLPAELKEKLQQEADSMKRNAWYMVRGYAYLLISIIIGFVVSMVIIVLTS